MTNQPPLQLQGRSLSIALHIGAHKTASTHLQRMLYRNRALLRDDGIRYFGPGDLRRPGRSLGAIFDLSWSKEPPSRRAPDAQLAHLGKTAKRLVFSEENFVGTLVDRSGCVAMPLYPNAFARLEELVAKWAPIAPQIFLGIRNPAAYLASVYSQALYGHNYVGPRAFRARNDWQGIDWAAYVARIRAVPGVGEVYVWRQEDYPDTKRLILRRMLRWRTGGRMVLSDERVHPGLSAQAVRQTLAWAQHKRDGDLSKEARKRFPQGATYPAFALYAPDTLRAAQEVYAGQVAQIDALTGVTMLRPPKTAASRNRASVSKQG